MRKGAQTDSAGEIELGRRLLWSEALRAGGMAVLWLSLGMLLTALYLLGSSRGSVMPDTCRSSPSHSLQLFIREFA